MKIVLGSRDYEKTVSGKYPKYNLKQMNLFVDPECWAYTGIQIVCNIICFDLFEKYQDEITNEQKQQLDNELKKHYGLHNVSIDDLVDWNKFDYVQKYPNTDQLKDVMHYIEKS